MKAHKNARLTVKQVLAIRAAHATGTVSVHALARKYGISQPHAHAIVHRRSWRWLKGPGHGR